MAKRKRKYEPLDTIWEVDDKLWAVIRPVLAEFDPPAGTGRRRTGQREALNGIIYRMRSGVQWNRLPKQFGDDSSVHRTMQRWEKNGADRDTGFEQTLRLDAKNEHEARAMAVMKLLSIAKVRCVELEDEVADLLSTVEGVGDGISASASSSRPAAQKRNSLRAASPNPAYDEILSGAGTLRVLAGVCNIIGGLAVIFGAIGGVIALRNGEGTSAMMAVIYGLATAFFHIALGAILGMFAGLGEAVRDIAINSVREK